MFEVSETEHDTGNNEWEKQESVLRGGGVDAEGT